ncbi:hypothetical protein LTR85_000918 [Meristemomyces frigidus]|nr:hypothetical protein LTR85_000918 [Meristemomyces frigidus]
MSAPPADTPISWALVARQANGEKVVKYKGVWMREERQKVLEHINTAEFRIMDLPSELPIMETKFRIMDLPSELRHHILSYLVENDLVSVYLPGNGYMPPTGIDLPVTARAGDKLLRQETLMLTIEQTTFDIHSFIGNTGFQAWLRRVDLRLASGGYTDGFDAVRSLSLPYFCFFPHATFPATRPNSDIELMLKCRNMEEVSIAWADKELWSVDATTGLQAAKTVQQLRTQYRLDRMLGLRRLKKLVLKRKGIGNIALHNLATWFRASMPDVDGQPIQVIVA